MQSWRAFGTEPFWNVSLNGETIVFSTPEDQQGKTLQGRRNPSLVGMVYTGKDGDTDFTLDISPGPCSDGMSDNQYDHVSTFIYGGTTYRGCAKAGN